MNKYIMFFIILLIVTAAGFSAHYLMLSAFGQDHWWIGSGYSLLGIYAFNSITSLVMLFALGGAMFSLEKQFGFVFLGGVLLKMIASYIFIQEGLGLLENNFLELNFLGVFFLFLFYDIYVAFRLIDQQHNPKGN
ncbi:hypothetical protein ACFRAE_06610 [Sphingobacterium sp. HJSM2_6]|uniref:hypothetical protein n=1 Tax=Sphingobacterium sp. HJSM2_6 TaxID=3366264 RepID=UPI003BD2E8A3